MAQDGQEIKPPSADDKNNLANAGTVTAVETVPSKFQKAPKVEDGGQMLIDFEAGQPDPQMTLFNLEEEGVGISPATPAPTVSAEGPKVETATPAALDSAGAATAEGSKEKAEAKPKTASDIAPVGEENAEAAAETTTTQPDIAPIGDQSAIAPKTNSKPADTATSTAPVAQDDSLDDEDGPKDTRYREHFAKTSMKDLNAVWGMGDVDDELKETLGLSGKVRKNDKYGLDFHLPNGHTIEWHANLGGTEFIGMRKRSAKFDEEDAHAVAVTALARGWKAINVHGSVKQKEMIWLQAKLAGLEVANFEPVYSDDPNNVRNRLARELEARADKLVIGASAAEQGVMNIKTLPDAPQTSRDAPPVAEADAPETPESATTPSKAPEAKEPEAKAPEATSTPPATDKPVENPVLAAAKEQDPVADAKALIDKGATVDTPEKPVETSFGKLTPPVKGEETPAKGVTIHDIIAQEREAAAGDPDKIKKLDQMDALLKGDKLTRDAVVPEVADAASKAGVVIPTKEAAAPAAADTAAPKKKNGGGSTPKP
ncbi:MAG TPA: hypothetical protein VEF76_10720 [Patescibacteria group bacterium]|nr:hypothetical protein [Patescibacteria group bacterium]